MNTADIAKLAQQSDDDARRRMSVAALPVAMVAWVLVTLWVLL